MLAMDAEKVFGGLSTFALLLLGILMSVAVYAQVVGGTLSGTATDASGALIPNTQISIRNVATGVARNVTTDAAGFYTAPNLLPGTYVFTATAPGFATVVKSGITLMVGVQQVLNITMQVGKLTERVEVFGEAPSVEVATSSIEAVVNSQTVRELPLNGRSWTDLATLQPGVAAIQTQRPFNAAIGPVGRGVRGFGNQIAISGARPQQNNYRLDGVSINDHGNAGAGSVLGGSLGVDAIEEFSVLTTNYSAEYGRTAGGVVNSITRSGTNQFHGDLYEFLRNNALDARNFFDRGKIPPFRRNQFGGSAGGPIQKGRTFLFGDYEGIRQSKGISQVSTVLSPAARAGNLSTGKVTVDPSVQKYFGLFPLPNGPLLAPGDVGIFSVAGTQIANENFFVTRLDHKFSDSDSLFATYMYDNTPYSSPDQFNNVLQGATTLRQVVALEENHTFNPSLINAIRFGFNRPATNASLPLRAINPLAKDLSLGAVPGKTATGIIAPGITGLKGGLGALSTFRFFWNSFQVYDDAFLTKRTHSIKFGAAFERMQLNELEEDIVNGNFTFSSLHDLLVNRPRRFDAPFPNLLTPRGLRQTLFGLYIQDDWRWHPNLTINLGLRYEMTTVPTEVQGKLSNLLHFTDPKPHLGDPYFLNPTLRNFEPRVGFAWDPFRNGKTALRGGFGLFDVLPLPYEILLTTTLAVPFFKNGSTGNLPPGSFYAGGFSRLGPTSFQATYVEHNPRRNYMMQWNLDVQREVTPNLTAMIAYVGSRGVHLPWRADDMDIVMPRLTSQGYLWPSALARGTTLNPNFGTIRAVMWQSNSSFNALETQITKRMSHGVQLQGSFTWGKSIDNSSSSLASDQFNNTISSLLWFNVKSSRGLSDFNIGRTLLISGIWQVPAPKSVSGPPAWILNGWELGGIFKASDGVPFSATFGTDGDPLGLNSSDPFDFPNRVVGPGCRSLINPGNPNNYIKTQCFAIPTAPSAAFYAANCDRTRGTFPQCFNLRGNAGRNILIGPGTSILDFSVVKNNHINRISESFNVQFRAEFFNALNHANFAVPVLPDNTDIFDSSGARTTVAGRLTSTTTTAREIQFALKLIW